MRIMVIADIHSNIYALEEVLKDIEGRSVDLAVCLGDLVGYYPFPNEVISLIRSKKILTIMGNYDDAVGNGLMVCGCDYPDPKDAENAGISLNWTIRATTGENRTFLKNLPREVLMTFENRKVRFVHGSPRQINEYLRRDSREASEVMADLQEDILVCGHTHRPYWKMYGEKLLVNAGSVGKPKTGNPNANYVIVDVEKDRVIVEVREVSYDYERTAAATEAAGLPEEFAEIVRTGKA
jgi:putative phosphoesterase